MNERNSFIVVTQRPDCVAWLTNALREEGEVLAAESQSLERILQLADLAGVSEIFVHLTAEGLRQEAVLIESLVAAKPFLPVLAIGDSMDNVLLLAAMRAGARDFITLKAQQGELLAMVRRIKPRENGGQRAPGERRGKVTAVVSARPGSDSPMLALHLALAIQEREPTLLLDLGMPHGDTLMYLGLQPSYSFVDAVRSLRRLDVTLIETGFARHRSGLSVLAMPDEPWSIGQMTSADVYLLLCALRWHFAHLVINLGGLVRSEFLLLMLSNVDNMVVLAEQSVPSCKQNIGLLKYLRENKIDMAHAGLVVDRYLTRIPPDADGIARSFGLPLWGTLPPSGMTRLTAMNCGESLFEIAPKDPYTLGVRQLTQRLAGEHAGTGERSESWVARLGARLRGVGA